MILAAALLLIAAQAIAAKPKLPVQWTELVASFDKLLEADGMVGGSIALVEDGRMVQRHDYGFADQAAGKKVDGDTIFHWASITKTLNAIGVMQLRDRGRLSLEDSIAYKVPELRRMHNPYGSMDDIKIYMLLEHSAGFQGGTWPYKKNLPWEPFEPTTWEQLVAMMPYQEIAFKPGTKSQYSNPSWIYLARVVEDATGDPWETYIQKNLFNPLGMSRSYFGYTPYYLKQDRSHGYNIRKDESGKVVVDDNGGEFDPGITIPNGGWNSPLADAVTYIAFLTGSTGGDPQKQRLYDAVLPRSTLEEMWRPPHLPASEIDDDYIGLAFFVNKKGPRPIIGHTGGQGNFSTMIYCNPQSKRGVVAAFNTLNSTRPADQESSFRTVQAQVLKVLE